MGLEARAVAAEGPGRAVPGEAGAREAGAEERGLEMISAAAYSAKRQDSPSCYNLAGVVIGRSWHDSRV